MISSGNYGVPQRITVLRITEFFEDGMPQNFPKTVNFIYRL
jgi:hypothetical protein